MEVWAFGVSRNYKNGMVSGAGPWPKKPTIKPSNPAASRLKSGISARG
jgi:hypothetical protein